MEHALAELPLAIFTTLAPMSAGAFIVIALAANFASLSELQLKKMDKLALIPFILAAVGLVASVLHLTNPLNAIYIVNGLGRSPLVNEIAVAGVFMALAFVYCLLGLLGKMSVGLRKILSLVVAFAAVLFAVFVGLAYMINTILSWYTPFTIIEVVGFCLLGGSLMGTMVVVLAGAFEDARASKSFKMALLAVAVVGVVCAVGGMAAHAHFINGLITPAHTGAALLEEVFTLFIVFIVAALLAFACELVVIFKGAKTALILIGVVIVIAAIFCARMVFYATQMSVAL